MPLRGRHVSMTIISSLRTLFEYLVALRTAFSKSKYLDEIFMSKSNFYETCELSQIALASYGLTLTLNL